MFLKNFFRKTVMVGHYYQQQALDNCLLFLESLAVRVARYSICLQVSFCHRPYDLADILTEVKDIKKGRTSVNRAATSTAKKKQFGGGPFVTRRKQGISKTPVSRISQPPKAKKQKLTDRV